MKLITEFQLKKFRIQFNVKVNKFGGERERERRLDGYNIRGKERLKKV